MKKYRIVRDNYSGYEAQVKFSWFPFVWFQANEFYWVNTWETPELAKSFIEKQKAGTFNIHELEELGPNNEFEREAKLLLVKSKSTSPVVVWEEPIDVAVENRPSRWRMALSSFLG